MPADSLPNPPRYPGEAKGNKRQSIHNSVQDPVAGKCQSVHVDGRAHDLGGHICTNMYERTAELVTELGMETEQGLL